MHHASVLVTPVSEQPPTPRDCRHLLRSRRQLRRHRRVLASRAAVARGARLARASCSSTICRSSSALPGVDAALSRQDVDGRHRSSTGTSRRTRAIRSPSPDVVIEAFGCELPHAYIAAMARREPQARLDQSRISERRGLGRRFPPAAVAAPALSARQELLLPGPRQGHRRRAEGARSRYADASDFDAHAWWRERVGIERPGDARNGRVAVRLRKPGRRRAARAMARRRRARRPARARRPHFRRARALFRLAGVRGRHVGERGRAAGARARLRRAAALRRVALGQPTSTSCAARIRSCARNGRTSRSSGTSIRKPTTPICRNSTPRSRITRARSIRPRRDAVARFWHAWNGAGVPDWADFWRHRQKLETCAAAGRRNWRASAIWRAISSRMRPRVWADEHRLTAFPAAPCDWPNKQKVS